MGEAAKKHEEPVTQTANDNARPNTPEWLTSKEAANLLKLKPSGLKSLVFRGKIQPDHRGGRGGLRGHRFRPETIQAYLMNKGQE
jgi:hypothetical protein